MRILLDMNLSPKWVAVIKSAGFDAIHWSEFGEADAPDSVLMDWAATHDHVVMTNDLDLAAILAATRQLRPSVVHIRSKRRSPASIGALVLRALVETQQDLLDGALVSIDANRTRVRILPLGV